MNMTRQQSSLVVSAGAVAILSIAMLAASSDRAVATTIYQDNFTQGGELNGAYPTVGSAAYTAYDITASGGAASWDGSSNRSGSGAAFLPISLQSGLVYTASVTMAPTGNPSNSDWLAFGFTGNTNFPGGAFFSDPSPEAWLIYRENGAVVSFFGGGTNNQVGGGTAGTPGTADTFTLTLNVDAGTLIFADTLGLVNQTADIGAATIAAIHDIGFSDLLGTGGTFSNFQVTSSADPSLVPEPATLTVLAAGIGAVGLVRRRRGAV